MAGLIQQRKQMFESLQASSVTKEKPKPKTVLQKSEDYAPNIFRKPMVLVDNESGKPVCNRDTITELSKIEKTLNIVSVVGTFRSGKSFLLNKLAASNEENGFQTGHTTKPVTKGIWVLCRPHPTQSDQVLVLLDTEGFDDPGAVQILDGCVFILTTLLSSTLVYNTRGNFDRQAIQKFEFLAGLKTSITVAGSDMDDSILDFFFPTLVLCLRDVTLKITEGSDQFLEDNLELRNGMTDSIRIYNHPRQLIRRYYKKRKCFIFEQPVKTEELSNLMKIPDKELEKGFQKTLNTFSDYVFSCAPKTLKCGRGVNGRMFSTLLLSYVNSVRDGQPPNIQVAMTEMAKAENAHAIQKAAEFYATEKLAAYDTPNASGLIGLHTDSMNAALAILKSKLVFDDKQIYEEQAMVEVCLQQFLEGKKSEAETVYQWVVEALKEHSGTKTKSEPPVQRISTVNKEMDDGQTEDVDSEDDQKNSERAINIESMQVDSMKRIESQYLEMLKLKIDELKRMSKEVSEEDPLFKQLLEETEFWEEFAKNARWNLPKYKRNSQSEKQERKGKCIIV